MASDVIRTERAERRQVAALPWRRGASGIEVLLITSRETRRWVTPKGGRMPGLTDAEAAAVEAFEEAGVEGRLAPEPLGTFRYLKVLKRRAPRWCVVSVYALEVTTVHETWQEQGQRDRLWMSPEQAAASVTEADLAEIIRAFG
ncbi:MAG: NUDIX hydrolase [Brevundimonas sp.]|nr:MAG: NUDIX hydrolase [Brevundimonas sp.]